MLSSMVKEHNAKQAKRKQEQETRRKEAVEASNEMTQALVDHLNVGVAQAYLNQKRLDAEAKQLHAGATNFAKQANQWLQLIDSFSSALKELGDVENWARSIEDDMHVIQNTLEAAYKASRQAQLQGQSQPQQQSQPQDQAEGQSEAAAMALPQSESTMP